MLISVKCTTTYRCKPFTNTFVKISIIVIIIIAIQSETNTSINEDDTTNTSFTILDGAYVAQVDHFHQLFIVSIILSGME